VVLAGDSLLADSGCCWKPDWFALAIGLSIFQLVHFVIRERSITAFPVQVRFFYLLLLLVSLPQAMQWLYWLPIVGTWAQLIFGYCTMARCVSLFPWNRHEKFSVSLLEKTFLSRPVRGSILQGFLPRNKLEKSM